MSEELTQTAASGEIKASRQLLVVMGILAILCAFAAMSAPLLTGVLVTTMIGISLIVTGASEMLCGARSLRGNGRWLGIVSGLLSLVAGALVVSRPLIGAKLVTLLLVGYLVLDGIARLSLAFETKPAAGWGMTLFSGVLSLMLSVMIWRGWPLSGLWAIGIILGIRLFFAGITLLVLRSAVGTLGEAIEAGRTPASQENQA
jgi:uncharacterized membrane protein HdeD (DUF308 family)